MIADPGAAGEADLLIALHARRSGDAVVAFRHGFPDRPIVVALTGTDLYRDLPDDATARRSLELADRIVTLQPHGRAMLPPALQQKTEVILQSAVPSRNSSVKPDWIGVALVGHLREEKDPFRVVEALRLLPSESRLRVVHAGRALDPSMEERARRETDTRYEWIGELPEEGARELIASSHLLVLTSIMEGGANVLSEATVDHVPIIASRIPSTEVILGSDYPGLFPPRDAEALARLLGRFEHDLSYRAELRRCVEQRAPLFDPAREREAWKMLLSTLLKRGYQ